MRIQRRAGSVYLDPDEAYELSVLPDRPKGAKLSGADNPVGSYDLGDCLLLRTESDQAGSVLIRDARRDFLEVCVQIIERELEAENPHIKTEDIMNEAYKARKASA